MVRADFAGDDAFVLTERPVEPVHDLFPRCRGAFLERDEGLGPLAGIGIGNTDAERLLDCLMLVEDRLDLARAAIEAPDGDHVLQALNHEDIACPVDEETPSWK